MTLAINNLRKCGQVVCVCIGGEGVAPEKDSILSELRTNTKYLHPAGEGWGGLEAWLTTSSQEDDKIQEMEARFLAKCCSRRALGYYNEPS